ncbi:MAG TPA: hypothetical protein VEJ63_21650 [Planctomycetota bacterium]|nr:hypothetical protein [Planctomycetota bacterium]
MMDRIAKRLLQQGPFEYAEADLPTVTILEARIADVGRDQNVITYSRLVSGVEFNIPGLNGNKGFYIEPRDWIGLHRRIIGSMLADISARSYLHAGFIAGALVIRSEEFEPSDIFFDWMYELKALPSLDRSAILEFWTDQVREAHAWYRAHAVSRFPDVEWTNG